MRVARSRGKAARGWVMSRKKKECRAWCEKKESVKCSISSYYLYFCRCEENIFLFSLCVSVQEV